MKDFLAKAILLDLDDTIVALTDSADPCWKRVCERYAFGIDNCDPEELFTAIKKSRIWFWEGKERHLRGRHDLVGARREIVRDALLRLSIDGSELANEIADAYSIEREDALQLMPGAMDALHHFRNRGIQLALITNGSAKDQRRKIEKFKLAKFFECIVIEGEYGVGKPNEQVYLHALEELGVDVEDVWMIGDNLEWEVRAPQKLGIKGIWLDHLGQGLNDHSDVQPYRVIKSLSELIRENIID